MKRIAFILGICFCFLGNSAPDLSQLRTSERGRFLLGLGIQFLVPDELSGFTHSQMVFCPRFYFPLGPGHFQLGASYGTGSGNYPEIDQIFLAEAAYRVEFETRFYTGFLSPGLAYSRYFSGVGEYKKTGPQLGWGIIFPLARGFRMNAEMRALILEKLVMGFGANFTFSL